MLRRSISLLVAGFLCSAAPTSLTAPEVASSGAFNVLSISIGGYGWDSDVPDPEKFANTMSIGMIMSRFDYGVIHVQEDFKLDYHCVLYEYDQHPFRTVVSSKVVSNPGLDTISKYSWIDYGRTWWNKSGSDAKKGFTFMRVRIDEGVYIDMVNLDASAGFEPRDQAARHWNIQQVTDFIDAHSYGNAVIVFGNTNSLYTSGTDNFRRFTDQNGLHDAWVQATGGISPAAGSESIKCPAGIPLNISCEVGDKVFFRESRIINLTVSGFFYDTKRFLTPTRIPLTARYPVRVEFDYTLKPGLRQSDLYGGPHGTWFNDLPSIPPSPKLSSITLRGGNRLDGLSLTLTSGKTLTHGGWGGNPYSLALEPGEYITSVKLCWGKKHQHTRIFYAEATTNQGNSVQAGKSTGSCETAAAPDGHGVVGVYGRDGDEVDRLGFIYAQQIGAATGHGYSASRGNFGGSDWFSMNSPSLESDQDKACAAH